MFLERYSLLVKFPTNYQIVCLEQMYIIFLNLANNHYQQDCNELILIQQPLNEVHFHHSYLYFFLLSVLPSNFIVSGVHVSEVQDNIHF